MPNRNAPTETNAQLLNFARDYDGDLILTLRVFDDGAVEPQPGAPTARLVGEFGVAPDVEDRLVEEVLPDEFATDIDVDDDGDPSRAAAGGEGGEDR